MRKTFPLTANGKEGGREMTANGKEGGREGPRMARREKESERGVGKRACEGRGKTGMRGANERAYELQKDCKMKPSDTDNGFK